jgi:signal transduction histidine kinase
MASLAERKSIQTSSAVRYCLIGTAYVLVYIALDWVSYDHAYTNLGITPWNPPPGLSLALLLRFGLGYVPWLAPAALAADLVVRGQVVPFEMMVVTAIITMAGYGFAAQALRNFLKVDPALQALRDVVSLLIVAVVAVFGVGVVLVGAYVAEGLLEPSDIESATVRFWVGDVSGIVGLTPFLLRHQSFSMATMIERIRGNGIELLLQGLAIFAALWLVFGIEKANQFQYFYGLFLPVLWIALRHGLDGVVVGVMLTQAGMMVLIQNSYDDALLATQFQIRMIALCITGLVTGAVVHERERAEAARRDGEARLRRLQAQLDQVGRSSAIGELATAIAHELSQPLSAINAYLGTCRRQFARGGPPDETARETLDKAHAQAQRASMVLTRLREFFRRGELTLERVALRQIVADALELVREEAVRAGVSLRIDGSVTDRVIVVDRVQIGQVLINLVRNAITAIAQGRGRQRIVTISAAELPGEVAIRVSDTGPGVPEDMIDELFWPLSHSKTGMGLGLAICRSIVEAHGGKVRYEPAPQGGACFVFTLPRGEDEPT